MKKNAFVRFLPCFLFLGILVSLFLRNGKLFLDYTQASLPAGYKGYTQTVEKHLSENLAGKYTYIDHNGAINKLLGINTLNQRFRLKNGYLASDSSFGDIQANADNIAALSHFLEEEGVGFLYAYIPAKEHSFDARMPAGYESKNQNEKVAELAAALDERQVNHLNLEAWFQSKGWKMEDIYFRTDHHWLPEAGFEAARLIMERLAQTGGTVYEPETLSPENWTFEIYEDWFLGSDGKKTGLIYAGLDDFTYIYPNFPAQTYVGRVNPDRTEARLDTTTVYRPSGIHIEDLYGRDPYGTYLGNNYPYAYIRNDLAVNGQRLLVVGDSYRLPTECFLSTQFREIIHVDMREYKDGSFAALVKQIQPDQVLLMGCIPAFEGVQNFGLEDWQANFAGKALQAPSWEQDTLSLEAGEFSVITGISSGAYRLTLEDASLGGDMALVQFALRDTDSGNISCARYFLSNYGEPQDWLFTVPEEGNHQIIAYQGMPGDGYALQLRGVTLSSYE